jgi:hypothetical protein
MVPLMMEKVAQQRSRRADALSPEPRQAAAMAVGVRGWRRAAVLLALALAPASCADRAIEKAMQDSGGRDRLLSYRLESHLDRFFSANHHWPDSLADLVAFTRTTAFVLDPKPYGQTVFQPQLNGDLLVNYSPPGTGAQFSYRIERPPTTRPSTTCP